MARKPTAQMISELEGKLAELEEYQEKMKVANLVYRRRRAGKTTEDTHVPYVPFWKYEMGGKPYSDMELQSNRRDIQRTKERLAFLREREVKEKEASQEMPETVHNHSPDSEEAKENTKKRPSVRKYLEESRTASPNSFSYATERAAQEDIAAEKMHKDQHALLYPAKKAWQENKGKQDSVMLWISDSICKQPGKAKMGTIKDSLRDYLGRKLAEKQETMQTSGEPIKSVQKHQKSFER